MTLVTLDQQGRIQIPASILEQLGLKNEDQLSLEVQDDKVILHPLKQEPEVYYEDGVLVVKAAPIGDVNLDNIIDDIRQERMKQILSW